MTEWEIENLPSSKTGKRMLKRVSPIYEQSIFMKMFYEGVGSEFDKVRAYFETLREQSFPHSVDWAIEYQEHKYSITPDKTLTLDERRARLKIKLQNKRPLNPAILEQYIADHYGEEIYLGESEPGFITLELEHFDKVPKFLKWLLNEKPAHLMIHVVVVKELLAPFYAGIGTFFSGRKRIPQGERVYKEGRQYVFDDGERKIIVTPDEQFDLPLNTGIALFKFGKIRIPSGDTSLPDREVLTLTDGDRELVITPENITVIDGDSSKVVSLADIIGDELTLRVTFPTSQRIITIKNPRPDLTADDVNQVADFIVQNEILLNKVEDSPQGINLAKIVTTTEEILF